MFTSQSFFSKQTVCAAEYRIYSVVSRGLQSFFIISWGSQSRAAYILYFCTLWKGLDDAQSFLGYILSTKPSFAFDFLQHHVHIRHRRDYDEQKAVVAKGADRGGENKFLGFFFSPCAPPGYGPALRCIRDVRVLVRFPY